MVSARGRRADSGAAWFTLCTLGSLGGVGLLQGFGDHYLHPTPTEIGMLPAGLLALLLAGLAAWRLARVGLYSWLLPVAALNLMLLRPGRAGETFTWRLEWGALGLAWTLAAVLVFARLLSRSDELERRMHLEGAAFALAAGLVAAVVYALFENRLPLLRAQWVAVVMLLAWWGGYLLSALKYRWHA